MPHYIVRQSNSQSSQKSQGTELLPRRPSGSPAQLVAAPALLYIFPGVMEVVIEEVFSTAEYYPIMFLDFSSFLSNNFFNTKIGKKTIM